MNKYKGVVAIILGTLLLTQPTMVLAKDYEEVSYDELVNELHSKSRRQQLRVAHDDFDDVRILAGVGLVTGFTNISAQQQNFNRHASGIQLALGMELFSPNWYSEGVFRNFGTSNNGDEELSLRDIDLKVGFKSDVERIYSYNIAAGLSNRFMKFSKTQGQISVNETTPSMVIASGIQAHLNRTVSLGVELSARSSLANQSSDKHSLDFAFRINTAL